MNKPFLQQTAEYLYRNYGGQLTDCCIVFPGRRAGLFFSDHLGNLTDKPMWSPTIFTINDFFEHLSGLEVADPVLLIYQLYKTYKKHIQTPEPFEDFYYWGEMLLNDFEDIDRYMVNTHDLFQNLAAIKSIEDHYDYLTDQQKEAIKTFWNSFNPEKPSKDQKAFLSLWEVIEPIYNDFNETLKNQSLAYEGMIYREVAQKIEQEKCCPNIPWGKVIFIGFNALTRCEELAFGQLQKDGMAEFIWDYDQYYVDNKTNEAGFFIRQNIKNFSMPEQIQPMNNIGKDAINIETYASSTDIGQAKIAGQILKKLHGSQTPAYNNTAMVLADESLLMPVLYSVPANIEQFNVTMGYSLFKTPVYSLVVNLVELQQHSVLRNNQKYFHFRDVLNILRHQFLMEVIGEEIKKIHNALVAQNKIYIDASSLQKNKILEQIFIFIDRPEQVFDYLLDVLYVTSGSMSSGDDAYIKTINREYIYHLYRALKRLKDIFIKENMQTSFVSFSRILERVMRTIRVPFTGEPLAGVQVMGLLETRVLDFENVILLSANEGILPASGAGSSFIPYNLRRGFKLPVIEHNDAIYAYYFYRLLQRAKNVFIIYNTKTDGLKTGEMSRFVSQLKYESPLNLKEHILVHNIRLSVAKPINIIKTPEVMEKIGRYAATDDTRVALSPSALNKYIDCPLKFYFSYIAGIDEHDMIDEEVDPASFGNIFHEVAKNLYQALAGSVVEHPVIEKLYKDEERINVLVNNAFTKLFLKDNGKIEGRNLIITEIIKKYIKRLLVNDMNSVPFTLLGVEKQFSRTIKINTASGSSDVWLKGMIDRIDIVNNTVRIIDYKTGRINNSFTDIESLFAKDDHKRKREVFQTFFYAMIYDKKDGGQPVKPMLYPVKSQDNAMVPVKKNRESVENYQMYADDFESNLSELIKELFDPACDFVQTENEEICKNCPYCKICHRD